MSPLALKIKGNKSFSPFANLDSEEDLSKTWRICTKVKDSLENGSRLENLSWRLWFRHHLLTEKSNAPFRKLSQNTARKLDHQHAKLPPFKDAGAKKGIRNEQQATKMENKGPENRPAAPSGVAQAPASKPPSQHAPQPASQMTQPAMNVPMSPPPLHPPQLQPEQQPQQPQQPQQSQQQQQQPAMTQIQPVSHYSTTTVDQLQQQQRFVLHQFTSDQASDQMIELEDIFGPFGDFQDYLPQTNVASVIAAANTIVEDIANFDFSSPWNINNYGPGNMYYPSTLGVAHQQSVSQGQPQQQQPQQQQQQPSQIQQTCAQMTVPAMMEENNAKTVFNVQQGQHQHLSFSVPSSPVMLNAHPQPHTNHNLSENIMYIPSDTYGMQTMGDEMQKMAQMPLASSTNAMFHQPDFATHSLSAPASTSSSSASMPSPPAKTVATETTLSHPNTLSQKDYGYTSAPATPPAVGVVDMDSKPKKASASTPNGQSPSQVRPICSNCGATSTPLWRRSADDELLCNACGLYQKLHNAPRPKTLKPHNNRKDAREDEMQLVCSNCSTTTTPLWRRDDSGAPLCNACGLYLKLHHERRPLSMKTDIIKKRQRYESGNSGGRKPAKKSKTEQQTSASTTLTSSPSSSMPPSPTEPTAAPHDSGPVFLNNRHFAMQGAHPEAHGRQPVYGHTTVTPMSASAMGETTHPYY